MEQNPEMQEETTPLEETPAPEAPAEEAPRYVPRPQWQVWAARIGLVLFIMLLIAYYMTMFRGGNP